MPSVCFQIKPESTLEEAWEELSSAGFNLLYSSEDEAGHVEIFAHVHDNDLLEGLTHVLKVLPADLAFIDWESQWTLHGANYHDGFVHVDLGNDREIRLKPGPGFGDLSHPTTQLVLKMMSGHIQGKDILDIGSGSGILSLAAVAMGAKTVWGVDIDPQAIQHAQENLLVNAMKGKAHFGLAEDYLADQHKGPVTVLINMIESEQQEAWASLQGISVAEVFASGILEEDRERYVQYATSRGWTLVDEASLDGWSAFHFKQRHSA